METIHTLHEFMLRAESITYILIAVGLIAGPSALDLVRSDEQISLLSQLGIAVLLFLVGIKLDVKIGRASCRERV